MSNLQSRSYCQSMKLELKSVSILSHELEESETLFNVAIFLFFLLKTRKILEKGKMCRKIGKKIQKSKSYNDRLLNARVVHAAEELLNVKRWKRYVLLTADGGFDIGQNLKIILIFLIRVVIQSTGMEIFEKKHKIWKLSRFFLLVIFESRTKLTNLWSFFDEKMWLSHRSSSKNSVKLNFSSKDDHKSVYLVQFSKMINEKTLEAYSFNVFLQNFPSKRLLWTYLW